MTNVTHTRDEDHGTHDWTDIQVDEYLTYIGYEEDETVYIRAYGAGLSPRKLTYKRSKISDAIGELRGLNQRGYNIVVTYNGGGNTKELVSDRRAYVSEEDTPLTENDWDYKLNAWRKAIGVKPTMQVVSGGKSVHNYYCLGEYNPNRDVVLTTQQRVTRAFNGDHSVDKLEQALRLPGFIHPGTGDYGYLVKNDNRQLYSHNMIASAVRGVDVSDLANKTKSSDRTRNSSVTPVREYTATDYAAFVSEVFEYKQPGKRLKQEMSGALALVMDVEGERNNSLAAAAFKLGAICGKYSVDGGAYLKRLETLVSKWSDQGKTMDTLVRQVVMGDTQGKRERDEQREQARATADSYYDFSGYDCVKYYHSKYVSDSIESLGNGAHGLISGKGSGKTTFIQRLVIDEPGLIHAVSHRESLVGAMERSIHEGGLGLASAKRVNGEGNVGFCVDSFPRVCNVGNAATVINDEASQALAHLLLAETEVKKNRTSIFEMYQESLAKSPRVILADADMSTIELDYLLSLRDDVTIHINTYVPPATKGLTIHKGSEKFIDDIRKFINAGEPTFIAFDSIKVQKDVHRVLTEEFPNMKSLIVNSETSKNKEQQAFIKDPSEAVKKYDVVFASPSLQTGVDISGNHIKHAAGLFGNWELTDGSALTSRDYAQFISRVRNPLDATIFMQEPRVVEQPETIARPKVYDGHHAMHDVMEELEAAIILRRKHLRSVDTLTELTRHLTERDGYKLTLITENERDEESRKHSERMKSVRQELREEFITAVVVAPDWSVDEDAIYKTKKHRGEEDVTPEERQAAYKFDIKKCIGGKHVNYQPTRDDVAYWMDGGKYKNLMFNRVFMHTQAMTTAQAHKEAYYDKYYHVFRSDRSTTHKRAAFILDVLTTCGIVRRLRVQGTDDVTYKTTLHEFTTESTDIALAMCASYSGYTTEIGDGHARKKGLAVVMDCLRAVGLGVTKRSTRERVRGKQIERTFYNIDTATYERRIESYTEVTGYPWESMVTHGTSVLGTQRKGMVETDDINAYVQVLRRARELGFNVPYGFVGTNYRLDN